jgi:hypothetical protein
VIKNFDPKNSTFGVSARKLFFLIPIIILSWHVTTTSLAQPASSLSQTFKPSNQVTASVSNFFDISIELVGGSFSETIDEKIVKFDDLCPKLGKHLIQNSGLWGTGPFLRFHCIKEGQSSKSNQYPWRLTINVDGKSTSFTISYVDSKTKNVSLQSEYKIDTSVSPLKILNEPKNVTLLAAYLTFGLPFRSTISSSTLRMGADLKLVGTTLEDLPPPAVPVEIFALSRNGNFWQFSPLGSASFFAASKPPKWLVNAAVFDHKEVAQGTISTSYYFVHQIKERKETQEKLAEALLYELDSFLGKLLGVARSAYVGTRFGLPLGKGEGVFAKAPLMGFFGEFRGGLLKGMHIYYDVIPKQQGKDELVSQEFSWSRFQAGYGFGLAFENPIINWVDIMPKLGVTSLELISSPTANSRVRPYSFKLNNAPTIGLEIGIERRGEKNLARIWAYGSYGLGALIEKNIKTASLRLGIDFYRELLSLGPTKIAALVFTAYDVTGFKKNLTLEEKKVDPNATDDIRYYSLFLGCGAAVTW